MTDTPGALRVKTIGALCTALECKLSDFCDYEPDAIRNQQKRRKAAGEEPQYLYKHKSKRPEKRQGSKFDFPDLRQIEQGKREPDENGES